MHGTLPPFQDRLNQLIRQPSVSSTDPALDMSNSGVVTLLADWLEHLGFSVCLQEVDTTANKHNLIASIGDGTGGLILSGHSDTVPFDEDQWDSDPLTVTAGEKGFHGLGTTDMKGFFAVALAAIEQIELDRLQRPLILISTADEESSMAGARLLASEGLTAGDAVIIGEPTSLQPIRMHKGILMQSIRITGSSGHSSNPDLGNSALDAMQDVLCELQNFRSTLQAKYRQPGFTIEVPTLNLGCVHGGDNPNRICSRCELQFDLRPLPGMSISSLRSEIDALLKPIAERRQIDISHQPLFEGVEAYEESADSELVTTAENLSGVESGAVAFATEAPFFQALGKQTLVLGPGSIDLAHRPNEYLPMDQIDPAIGLYTKFIAHYCL